MYVWTDGRTENLPILQDFVPYRGRCPACHHENQGVSTNSFRSTNDKVPNMTIFTVTLPSTHLLLNQGCGVHEKEGSLSSLLQRSPYRSRGRHQLFDEHDGDEGFSASRLQTDDRVLPARVIEEFNLKGTRSEPVRLQAFWRVVVRGRAMRRSQRALSASRRAGRRGARLLVVMAFVTHF